MAVDEKTGSCKRFSIQHCYSSCHTSHFHFRRTRALLFSLTLTARSHQIQLCSRKRGKLLVVCKCFSITQSCNHYDYLLTLTRQASIIRCSVKVQIQLQMGLTATPLPDNNSTLVGTEPSPRTLPKQQKGQRNY